MRRVGEEAALWHQAQMEAYRHALEMMGVPEIAEPPETTNAALATLEAAQAERDAAVREVTQWAREAGLAKGKLEMSEAAGIVDGWKERAEKAEAENVRLRAEVVDLKSSVVAFCGPHAAKFARDFGLPPGHLHATHYDILERAGARLSDFTRWEDLASTSGEGS